MDRVRFGRALGFGARQAMKTLVTAVDAATAENPSIRNSAPNQPPQQTADSPAGGSPASRSTTKTVAHPPDTRPQTYPRTHPQTSQVKQRLGRGGKRFGEAVWESFARLSGVLWLEVTGVFFGLFALVALGHLWKLLAEWHAGTADAASRRSLIGAAIMFAIFGYFCASSFMRAHRRERRR